MVERLGATLDRVLSALSSASGPDQADRLSYQGRPAGCVGCVGFMGHVTGRRERGERLTPARAVNAHFVHVPQFCATFFLSLMLAHLNPKRLDLKRPSKGRRDQGLAARGQGHH
jgi:hypothetical protein